MKQATSNRITSISILLNALLALGSSGPASANLIHWTNPAGGDFSTASNWNPNQVPGPGDEPVFGLDEIFSVGFDRNYTTDFLRMRKGDVTFDLGGFTYTTQLLVGDQPGSNPMLRVTNGRLATSYGRIGLERGTAGAVTVTGGGSVWDAQFLVVGNQSDSSGAVLVDDGAQLISGSALLSSNPGSTALVTVTGAGSTWTTRGTTYFGFSTNTNPRLVVENGGQVINTGVRDNGWVHIGVLYGTRATASVTGKGSKWTIGSTMQVGGHTDEAGDGITPGGTGTLLIADGGEVRAEFGIIAASTDSTGDATVTGAGSTWTIDYLGIAGGWVSSGTGRLLIADGGRVNSANVELATIVGTRETGTGAVTVTGVGSTWDVTGQGSPWARRGIFNLGSPRGNGSVTIGPGALVTVGQRYNQHATATLRYELASADPVTGFGLLDVTGQAMLNGTLEVALVDGFVPEASDTFTLLTATAPSGYFANAVPEGDVATLTTPQGTFTVTYNSDSVVLSNFQK